MPAAFRLVLIPALLALLLGFGPARAATVVKFGTITQLTGPQDLDLDGEIVYAINFSPDDPVRTVRGVPFLPDNKAITGATLVGPNNVVAWQAKPDFGNTPDADQLEEIMSDIRWADNGSGQRLKATLKVNAGEQYKLQVLISGNSPENRRWDIRVNGADAVDEITSIGASPGESYSVNRSTLYTCLSTPATTSFTVEMGNLFGGNDGGDRNPIWQALILKRMFVPPTPDDLSIQPNQFFAKQTAAVGAVRVTDRKFGATHTLSLVAGTGDTDNAKFTLSGADLLPKPFDFSSRPVGSVYSVRVRAVDAAEPARFLEKALSVTIAASHAPTGIVLDSGSVNPYAAPGALAAHLSAVDPDSFDRILFSLVAGTGSDDNALFAVSGSDLRLSKPLPVGATQVRVRLRATDLSGFSFEQSFTLAVEVPQVAITEMLATEIGGVPDETAQLQEWIELRNKSAQWVDLAGFYLSDQPDNLKQWKFPAGSIPPNGFLLVLADGRGVTPAGSTKLHANFSLNSAGQWLALVLPDGATILDKLIAPEFFPGISYGVDAQGKPGYFRVPTPGAANGELTIYGKNEVTFNVGHGFYTKAFSLELAASAPGSTIRYTLDGTMPSATAGTVYTGPVQIKPNTTATTRGSRIVRAIAINPKAGYAPVNTQTYLFVNGATGPAVDGVVAQGQLVPGITKHAVYGPLLGDAFLALPAVSVVMAQGLSTAEYPASVELFDPKGAEQGFQIDCGISATGTTSLGSPKLSMAAKFRSKYGPPKLRYPMFARGSRFPDGAATEFDVLRLRSHSHDTFYWLGTRENPPVPYGSPSVNRSGDAQLARNPWIDEMQLAMGQPGKHGRQVHMFLNGAYHGIYHIHEHADDKYMASYYPGGSDEYHFTGAATTGSDHEGGDSWSAAWSSVKASLANYATAKRWIDTTNLCDYMLLSFYAGNDWDWSAQHNWSAAGPKAADRGGWKFFQQDSDITLQDIVADCTDQDVPDGIFTSMMRFPDFKVLFRDRVYKHCYNGGMLTPAKASAFYDFRMNEIYTAIIAETARWQPGSSVATLPWDRDQEWTNEWKYIRNTYFPQRTTKLLQQLRAHTGWWPIDPLDLNKLGGTVPAGFPVTFAAKTGTVYFTTDGSDPRLPGGGVNPAARRVTTVLTNTTLIKSGDVWHFLDDGTDPDPAWTTQGFNDSAWRSGPTEIGYGDGSEATVAVFVDTDPATPGAQRNITTYFRKTFDAPRSASYKTFKLSVQRDDGAVVYLNGTEIWRSNMAAGAVTSRTLATNAVEGVDELAFVDVTINASLVSLRDTGNVLAAEVHQMSPDSPDMSFNLELTASGPEPASTAVVDRPMVVRARVFANNDWSALVEGFFTPDSIAPASASNLIISEIHYHPVDEAAAEFLEFLNTSATPLDLSGVVVTNAVNFVFPKPTMLSPGERLVVAKDLAVFGPRYLTNTSAYYRAGIRVLGPWDGSLSNAGETVQLLGPDGSPLFSCAYGTTDSWPGRADGKGSSLELIDPSLAPLTSAEKSAWLGDPLNWRPSSEFHGSPGFAGAGPDNRVVINELLPVSLALRSDAIELKNITASALDIGGWLLSDASSNYRKYRFIYPTVLSAGAYLVLTENDFNNSLNPANLVPFVLDDAGESLYLMEANPAGDPLRFADRVTYGVVPASVSVGRWPDGVGPFARLQNATFGAPNSAPVAGYDSWASTVFPPGTPAETAGPNADPDHDGYSNYAEYAFVLNPLEPSASPLRLTKWQGEDGFAFAYRTRTAAPDLNYRIEVSVDLKSWDGTGLEVETLAQTPQPDGSTLVTARLRHADQTGARFVRLAVGP